ncbi:MAG: class IV adenylate cyclase [Candidatus Omnitrophica bacterium]|nr:class IV adenylate cyclase [Candidatus Omnitrophota bacterium]
MFEIEQKYKIRDLKALKAKLEKIAAVKISRVDEYNQLFDLRGSLKKNGKTLRLRLNQPGNKAVLTYKGPLMKGKYKKRVEIETPVDHDGMQKILEALGYVCRFEYSKKRITYRYKKTIITIDTLNNKDLYCELEGTVKGIDALTALLGFKKEDREERSYPQILRGKR